MRIIVGTWVVTVLTVAVWPQSPQDLSPRELFYEAVLTQHSPSSTPTDKSATRTKRVPVRSAASQVGDSSPGRGPLVQARYPVANLGIRYSVMLQNPVSLQFEPVDVDREYQTGDCFVLDVEPNYSGYLYIFARGSSSAWQPLFPFLTPGESNQVDAHRRVRIPSEQCLELKPPSGVEHVFVVFGLDRQDFVELNAAIEQNAPPEVPATAPRPRPEPPAVSLDQTVDLLYAGLRDRDIGVKKIEKAVLPEESPHSVYAVNMSAQPRSRIVAELCLRH